MLGQLQNLFSLLIARSWFVLSHDEVAEFQSRAWLSFPLTIRAATLAKS